MVSRDIMFDEVSCYYPSQVISFKNINHNNENDICSKPVIEIPLPSNALTDIDSSSSSSVSTPIIFLSPMIEQSDRGSNDIHEEKIQILRR